MNCQLQAEARLIAINNTPAAGGTLPPANGAIHANPPGEPDHPRQRSSWISLILPLREPHIGGNEENLDTFQREVRQMGYWTRFTQLFLKRRIRRATVAACVVMISQQLCGVSAPFLLASSFRIYR